MPSAHYSVSDWIEQFPACLKPANSMTIFKLRPE